MATDIRRMSKEALDELNRQGAIWRAHNKPAQPVPGDALLHWPGRYYLR